MSSESIAQGIGKESTRRTAVNRALEKLRAYVEDEGFKGYDPYDTLNARIDLCRFGK